MKGIKTEDIKKLREKTGAPVMECKRALEEARGDFNKAKKILTKWGVSRAQKKKGKEAGDGLVYAYIHPGGKIGVLVEVNCETDFVAKTEDFQRLAREIAMQIASMNPKNVEELLKQAYIREAKKTVGELVDEVIAKVGENIRVGRFIRYRVGN
jgi:elongation factor Ts